MIGFTKDACCLQGKLNSSSYLASLSVKNLVAPCMLFDNQAVEIIVSFFSSGFSELDCFCFSVFINNEVVDVKKKIVKGSIILVCVEDIFLNIVSDNRKKNALTELSRPPIVAIFRVLPTIKSAAVYPAPTATTTDRVYANWSG